MTETLHPDHAGPQPVAVDPIARQIIEAHVKDCDAREERRERAMERIEGLFRDIWKEIGRIKAFRTRILLWLVGGLAGLCVGLIAYIWEAGTGP